MRHPETGREVGRKSQRAGCHHNEIELIMIRRSDLEAVFPIKRDGYDSPFEGQTFHGRESRVNNFRPFGSGASRRLAVRIP